MDHAVLLGQGLHKKRKKDKNLREEGAGKRKKKCERKEKEERRPFKM